MWMVEHAAANAAQQVPTSVADMVPSPSAAAAAAAAAAHQRAGLSPTGNVHQTPPSVRAGNGGPVPPPQGEPLNLASSETPAANVKRNGSHDDVLGVKRRPQQERERDRDRCSSPPPKRPAQDNDFGALPATHIKIESRGNITLSKIEGKKPTKKKGEQRKLHISPKIIIENWTSY
jgi:hypothetical protein